MSHEPVAELSDERIGGNSAESVATSTLETNSQFADRQADSLVLTSCGIELSEYFHSSLHLVAVNLLCNKELYAVVVVFA